MLASYGLFYIAYITALTIFEVMVGVAFAVRARIIASRRVTILAAAFAWSAPLAIVNVATLPGIENQLIHAGPDVAPMLWVWWHGGWALALAAFAFLPERPKVEAAPLRLSGFAFVAALIVMTVTFRVPASNHVFIAPNMLVRTPLFDAAMLLPALVLAIVLVRLSTAARSARNGWIIAAVALSLLEPLFVLASPARFGLFALLARLVGLCSVLAMCGAIVEDTVVALRRALSLKRDRLEVEQFRMIAEEIPQIAFIMSGDGRNEFSNAHWTNFTGASREAALGEGFLTFVHPDDRERRAQAFATAVRRQATYETSFRLRRGDGEYRRVLTRAVPIARDGTVVAWVGTCTDVEDHEQRVARAEREASEVRRARVASDLIRAIPPSLEGNVILGRALGAAIPQVADWIVICLPNDAGEIVVVATEHREAASAAKLKTLHGAACVVGSHTESVTVSAVVDGHLDQMFAEHAVKVIRALEPRSLIVVPLWGVGGSITFAYGDSSRTYVSEDLEALEAFAYRVAEALLNAERYAHEHRVAERFQRASLPATLPCVGEFTLDAVYEAGRTEAQIGGDWYDAFEIGESLIFSIGDVLGSGLEAAVTMGAIRQGIRTAAELSDDPKAILAAADRALRKTSPDTLATCFVGVLHCRDLVLTFASAGHPPPIVRRADGTTELLKADGLPLGLRQLREAPNLNWLAQLYEGDLLVLYTDGLTEHGRDVVRGEADLISAIRSMSTTATPASWLQRTILGSSFSRDDVAILTIGVGKGDRE